jgi:hypothetical protein
VTGSLTSLSDAFIQITSEGGAIADDAFIVFDTGSFSANSLLLQIDSLHGTIGGDPIINLTATGTVTTTGDATVDIDLTQDPVRSKRPATTASIATG